MGAETFSVPAGETFELDVFDAVGTNVADNVVELNEGATLKLVKSELVGNGFVLHESHNAPSGGTTEWTAAC